MAPEIDQDETDCELLKRPPASPPMCSKPPTPATHPAVCRPESPSPAAEASAKQAPVAKLEMKAARCVNRCTSCKKRVGLTGFRCRCGELFCGRHRYSDVHDCSFDYKAAGKAAIAKANPVVRAAKIIKI